MKDNPNRAGSTLPSLVVWLCAALMAVAIGVGSGFTALGGLTTGWKYSFGIVFNDTTKIYRSSSPTAYWIMIGFYTFTCLAGIIIGIMTAIENIKQYKKTAEQKKKSTAVTK